MRVNAELVRIIWNDCERHSLSLLCMFCEYRIHCNVVVLHVKQFVYRFVSTYFGGHYRLALFHSSTFLILPAAFS